MSSAHDPLSTDPSGAEDADQVVRVSQLDAPMEGAWNRYVRTHPRGKLYYRVAWRDLLAGLFGHSTCYLYAANGRNEIVGVLPLMRLKSWLFGNFMISIPYVNYGGAIGDSEQVEQVLMERACEIADSCGAAHIEFRDTLQRDSRWSCRTDKVVMERPLPSTPEKLWQELGSKVRAQVKRPRKEGASVIVGTGELVPEFYRVFARNMRDLGTPVYPRVFFESIADTFTDDVRILVVRLNGKAVAAGFLIRNGERIEIPWAASMREYNRYGVNMLLYWGAMEHAIEEGRQIFDFGRSTRNAGTYRFKAQWGAEPRQLYWHYWLKQGQSLPALTPDNPRYRLAIRAWRLLPVSIANRIGPFIVRNLP